MIFIHTNFLYLNDFMCKVFLDQAFDCCSEQISVEQHVRLSPIPSGWWLWHSLWVEAGQFPWLRLEDWIWKMHFNLLFHMLFDQLFHLLLASSWFFLHGLFISPGSGPMTSWPARWKSGFCWMRRSCGPNLLQRWKPTWPWTTVFCCDHLLLMPLCRSGFCLKGGAVFNRCWFGFGWFGFTFTHHSC